MVNYYKPCDPYQDFLQEYHRRQKHNEHRMRCFPLDTHFDSYPPSYWDFYDAESRLLEESNSRQFSSPWRQRNFHTRSRIVKRSRYSYLLICGLLFGLVWWRFRGCPKALIKFLGFLRMSGLKTVEVVKPWIQSRWIWAACGVAGLACFC